MITVPLAEAQATLAQLIDELGRAHERIELTREGRRAAVIISADDYDSMIETLEVLSDDATMADIRESGSGVGHSLSEVTEDLRATGRLPR